jgi:hypothetical protein
MQRDTDKKQTKKRKKREKQTEEEMIYAGSVPAKYTDQYGLEQYLGGGIAARTFSNIRGRTPKKWSIELVIEAMRRGEMIGPPCRKIGKLWVYDLQKVDSWYEIFPEIGTLPDMEQLLEALKEVNA